ncbi:TPR repeat-containing protein DDB_G0287407-like [Haliotis cracherodii]|uniref:TPR repeat-containing protein DDB_G0287407-like n=1 Tax=Haliotis cracherodii TaxID=6455 RepID=UPI0039E7B888
MYQKYKHQMDSQEEGSHDQKAPKMSDAARRVESCWMQIDAEEEKYQDWKPPPPDLPGFMGWRTVRIFVSSTFTDFFNEREILVKKVFPELREWGSERKIRIIDCDLRWGVPQDSTTAETIAICMEELDTCHHVNEGEPFFLNLVGERYGWIPGGGDITEEVRQKYDWVEGTSITFMEVLHGAYRKKNPNAAFFLRDPAFLSEVSETHVSRFIEAEDLGREHLKMFKTRLKQRFPDQIFSYSVQAAGMSSSTGREKVQLTGLDDFADQCLEFFKSAITRKYPEQLTLATLSLEEQEKELQRIFIIEKAELVIGREQEVQALMGYMTDPGSCDLSKIVGGEAGLRKPDLWTLTPQDNLLCVVQAKSGWGKTSLLAHLVLTAIEKGHKIFYHFSGSTSRSRDTSDMLFRLMEALTEEEVSQEERENFSTSVDKQQELLNKALAKFQETGRKLTIIIDAVNELNQSNLVDHLSWLPPSVPSNIAVIVSCNEHPPTLARLKEHPCYWMTVGELGESHMRSIAVSYLGRYNKHLHKDQLTALTQDTRVDSPLWMTLVCEELRVFGDFQMVTQKIHSLPDTLDGLFGVIFNRLLAEDDTGCIKKAVCLIATSPSGMATEDVLKLLGDVGTREEAPPLHWALARRHLKPYLRVSGFPAEFVTFSHEKIFKAVEGHVITSRDERNKWQVHLADFYQYWSDNSRLRTFLLPDLLRNVGLKDRMVKFMTTDKDSWAVSPYQRSSYLRWCRCTRPTGGSWSSKPVMICTFCRHKQQCFNPANRWQAHVSCVICGANCFSPMTATASLCTFHGVGTPTSAKCVICKRHMSLQVKMSGDIQGRLCGQCGFGNYGKMCSYVGQ